METMETETATRLRDMLPGTVGRVVGYEQAYRGYIGRLISLGLAPGTEFITLRIANPSESVEIVEINVQGLNRRLRKQEADALIIEEVSNNIY